MDAEYVGREKATQGRLTRLTVQVVQPLQRQCAWCLRLINDDGEPVSVRSLPKLYEATHGICYECGEQWLEELMNENTDREHGESEKLSRRELLAHLALASR